MIYDIHITDMTQETYTVDEDVSSFTTSTGFLSSPEEVPIPPLGPSLTPSTPKLSHRSAVPNSMTKELRMKKHLQRLQKQSEGATRSTASGGAPHSSTGVAGGGDVAGFGLDGGRIASLLRGNEDVLLNFVAKVNKVYNEKLRKPAPFMTFVLCGMQSAGKSTIMERFLGSVLNIVQEGTGTRCPLDTTCIHDESCPTPKCNLWGAELAGGGSNLSVEKVFNLITNHNKKLAACDSFSTEPLRLEFRSSKVQNMRYAVPTASTLSYRCVAL
jgi:hypothetical protein